MSLLNRSHASIQPSTSITEASSNSLDEDSHKPRKASFSFMERRLQCRILYDGVDHTPDTIVDQDFVTISDDSYSHAAFETRRRQSDSGLKALQPSRSQADAGMRVYATTIDLDDIQIDHTIDTEKGYPPADIDLEQAPSAFYLPKSLPLMSYPPEIFVSIRETPTVYLFELPSFSYDKGSTEGNTAEEENEYYQYITAGKGRNRKMVMEETQTRHTTSQTRHTLATRPAKRNQMSFASVWDMHDTYAKLADTRRVEEDDEMVMYQSAAAHLLRKKRLKTDATGGRKADTFAEVAGTPQFNDAVMLTERVLASKQYTEAQKRFRGLVTVDPLAPDLIYVYTLKPLWTFECSETANRPITSISFNPKNPNILATGHGKFGYAEQHGGIVCVWCTKNPSKPERLYRFEAPLTSVAFSEQSPSWLACGFANGDVCILDVTSYTIKMIAKSKRETNPSFEPIWVANWCTLDKTEFVMTAGQDGRIGRFTSTKTHDFICTPMMRISTVEGRMKGLECAKPCLEVDVPVTRYPAALCMKWHPSISHVYLVGTDEGCIHKCSTHYLNQHMEVFRAHAGPVYGLEYSPFMSALLVSCGADNSVRLWIEDMEDVIMTLTCPAAVYGVAFCPTNSTILISVSGNVLSVWDLRRKTHIPCAEYTFPGHVVLTYIRFSASGDNVFVGDTLGRVHTFHLEDTPIPPYNQLRMLDEAIKRALCTRPKLLKQMAQLERFKAKYLKK